MTVIEWIKCCVFLYLPTYCHLFHLHCCILCFIRISLRCCSSKCALSETNQLFNIAHSHAGTYILLSHVLKSVINLKQYQLLLMKNKPMVIHCFILLQNPSIIPQHLLAYWWLGRGGQLFKCDRWSLVSGCCCCCCCCSLRLWPSRPQRAWDEPEPQYNSAEKPFVVAQSVFRRRANGPPLLSDIYFNLLAL